MANNKQFEKYKEILEKNAPENCQACGGPVALERVNLEDYHGGKLYLMESVPAYVCEECGEVWVPEPIMAEFEKMIETVKLHGKPRKNETRGEKRKEGKKKKK